MKSSRGGSAGPVGAEEAAALFAPLKEYSHLALAVSGGADSMALMWLLARWGKAFAPKLCFHVLSVDHGLRMAARTEAEQVGKWAAELGLQHHLLFWRGEKPQTGVQAAAREARYGLLTSWCRANGAGALVLGHHLDDQTETVLMRFMKGSGIDGLCGMRVASRREGVRILRPLLQIPKARLVATLQEAGHGWLEDPSNQDPKYERVRIRRGLKHLEGEGFEATVICQSAKRLTRICDYLDTLADDLIEKAGDVSAGGFVHLEHAVLAAAPEETGQRVLRRILGAVGGRPHPPRRSKIEALFEHVTCGDERGATLGGCRVFRRAGRLWFVRELRGDKLNDVKLEPGLEHVWDNRFLVKAPASGERAFHARMLGGEGWRFLKKQGLDIEKLPAAAGQSLVSFWRAGVLLAVPFAGYIQEGSDYREGDFKAEFFQKQQILLTG
jgi:tRNA(Ile)-lysidine synthase